MSPKEKVGETVPAEKVEEIAKAKSELTDAIRNVKEVEGQKGPAYGVAVEKVGQCVLAGMTRAQTAKVIAQAWGSDKESKGLAARYIILDRYTRGEYAKNEKSVEVVKVEEGNATVAYHSPVEMLKSGK